jgi:esterase/lipase superfamily enzyme
MASSAVSGHAARFGVALIVTFAILAFGGLMGPAGPAASAQGADQWVTLASRDLDTKTGRATIDLSRAKGAYKSVRIRVSSGAVALTQIELRYHGGGVRTERRALVLRAAQGPRIIDSRSDDAFLDRLVLSFRGVAGEPERAMLVVEGLQSPGGAVAVRGEPTIGAAKKEGAARAPETEMRRTKKGAARPSEEKEAPKAFKTEPPPPPPAASAPPPVGASPPAPVARSAPPSAAPLPSPSQEASRTPSPGAEPPPTAGGTRSISEPWDVVPVFYGTDRNRIEQATRISYGSERARRLELGRALVTVPKSHEVPNIERPWVYRLPFTQIVLYSEAEDPKKHFTIKEVRALTREDFQRLVRERLNASKAYKDHALVFIHGFNTSFEHALFRTAQIAYDIKFDGAPFLYSWPSKGALSSQDYSYDRESAGAAEPYLRTFLETVSRETGATNVSVIAHSMGNQLLLPVLRDLKYGAPPNVKVSQVILAAPDVDRDAFENIAKEVIGVSRGVTVLAASNDRALDISRRFWGGVPRAGDVPAAGPVVVEGVDTIDITAVSTLIFALNHSGYAETNALLSDIQRLIQTGERPPDKRVPILERVKTDRGDYWRYPRTGR